MKRHLLLSVAILLSSPIAYAVPLYYDDGLTQMNEGSYREAARLFEKAVEQSPRDAKAWERLGDACAKLGQEEKALRAYGKALEIRPGNKDLRKWVNTFKVKAANVPTKDAAVPALSRVAELSLGYGIGYLQASQGTRNVWSESHSYGVWAGYRLNPRLAIGGIGDLIRFTPDVDAMMRLHTSADFHQAKLESDGGMLDVLFAAVAVKLNFSLEDGPVMPYFLAGLGILNRSMDPTSLTALDPLGATISVQVPGNSSTGLGCTVGLGIPIRLKEHLQLTVDARETAGFTAPEKTALHHLGFGLLYLW